MLVANAFHIPDAACWRGGRSVPRLILVKHSSPEVVPSVPASQWHLSESGRAQCTILAERLCIHRPDVVMASSEPKAAETAQIVTDLLGLPLEMNDTLREHDRSNVPFASTEDFDAAVARFFIEPQRLILGRETADQAHERFAAAVEAIIARYPAATVAVVTHGTVMALFVARAAAIDPFPLWRRLGTPAFIVLSLPDRQILTVVDHL